MQRLCVRRAASAVVGALILANSAFAADDKPAQKPAPKPAASQPAAKPAPAQAAPRPAPSQPPKTSPTTKKTPVQASSPRKETIKEATTRMQSNPYVVNTSSRTAPFVGAAPGGAKRDLDRMTRQGGSTLGFDGGRGSTLNSGVRPDPVQTSTTTARTTLQPYTTPAPRSHSEPPPPAATTPSSPSLRDKVRKLFR